MIATAVLVAALDTARAMLVALGRFGAAVPELQAAEEQIAGLQRLEELYRRHRAAEVTRLLEAAAAGLRDGRRP